MRHGRAVRFLSSRRNAWSSSGNERLGDTSPVTTSDRVARHDSTSAWNACRSSAVNPCERGRRADVARAVAVRRGRRADAENASGDQLPRDRPGLASSDVRRSFRTRSSPPAANVGRMTTSAMIGSASARRCGRKMQIDVRRVVCGPGRQVRAQIVDGIGNLQSAAAAGAFVQHRRRSGWRDRTFRPDRRRSRLERELQVHQRHLVDSARSTPADRSRACASRSRARAARGRTDGGGFERSGACCWNADSGCRST